MCVCWPAHTCVPCAPGVTEGVGSPGTTVTDRYKPPVGARNQSGPLQEQLVLSAAESSRHPAYCDVYTYTPVLRTMTGYHRSQAHVRNERKLSCEFLLFKCLICS